MSEKSDELEYQNQELLLREGMHRIGKSNNRLNPTGICHNCEEAVDDKLKLFCDKDCAEDYEKWQAAERARRN